MHRSTDLNQAAQLVLSHPSGSGARDVAGDLHLLHGLDVGAEVCEGGSSCRAYVHHHQPVYQTGLWTMVEDKRQDVVETTQNRNSSSSEACQDVAADEGVIRMTLKVLQIPQQPTCVRAVTMAVFPPMLWPMRTHFSMRSVARRCFKSSAMAS